MTQATPQIESYFPTPFGFGMNKELADHYLPIIKRILDEKADSTFFYKGRTTHNQDDFRLATAADIVADPSAPGAFVNGIMENKEWLFVEGRYVECDIDNAKRQIRTASSKQIEEVALHLFENFLRKL